MLFSQKEKRLLALRLQHENKVFYLHPRYSLAYPLGYCAMMGLVSLALTVILLIRKKCSVYGAVAIGLTVFMGLFVLDAVVVIRYLGITPPHLRL